MIQSPSQFQSEIFSEIQSGQTSLLIDACAGSGKTSTILHATSLIPIHVLTVFLAFNKNIATELESRVPRHIQVGTFHSRCLRALSRGLPKSPKIDKDKVRTILKSNLSWKDFELYSQFVCKLVSLAKSAGLGLDTAKLSADSSAAPWTDLIGKFGLSGDSPDFDEARAIDLAGKALAESNETVSVIDFDDMLYLALLRNTSFDKASFIFVDEAQDTNFIQRELLKRMGNFIDGSRLVAVGDPHQAIYGFRGADSDSMETLATEFSAKRLPLSISYRCSKAVVKEAQKYL